MPGRVTVINKRDISYLADIIYAIISVSEGKTANEALKSMDQRKAEKAAESLAYIEVPAKQNSIVF